MEKGNIVWLEGKSRHGKNRIEQHGNPWTVNAKGKFNGDDAVRMRSERETFNIGQGRKMHDERWVFLKDDPNFWVISSSNFFHNKPRQQTQLSINNCLLIFCAKVCNKLLELCI